MRRLIISSVLLAGGLLAGCSLAGDVTPPPALATQQAAAPQATTDRPQATSPAVEVELERMPASAPDPFSGALIYAESCAPCHGAAGLGDGEMAGNLEVPISSLGDPTVAREVIPSEWYKIVTLGRMDRFMPPFRSLGDAQRWDVVAYALSLSTTESELSKGKELYQQACASCHGEDGRGAEYEVPLIGLESFANRSLAEVSTLIERGAGEMPVFGDVFDEDDRMALAAYTRALTYQSAAPEESEPQAEAETEEAATGTLRVSVSNGTEGASVPDTLEVTIVGFDGETQTVEEIISLDAQGQAELRHLEIVPGRIFGAIVEHQSVQYFSTGGHLVAEDPQLELDLTIFETTPDTQAVEIERLHVIFDYAVEGIVEISELWLVNNTSDRTVVQRGGSNALPIELPEGFGEVRYGDEALAQRVTATEDGFVYHEPVRPGEPLEVIFTFTLPYERSLDFVQPIDYPVGAVVILTEESAPDLTGSGLNDEGTREIGELVMHTYSIGTLEPGSKLALSFRGRHPAGANNPSTTNLLIGSGVLVLTLGLVLFGWQSWTHRTEEQTDLETADQARPGEERPTRAALLGAIADLDNAYESDDLERSDYNDQRAALKQQLIELMTEDDD